MARTPVKLDSSNSKVRLSKDDIKERQKQVGCYMAQGKSYREIALLLGVGHNTVKRDVDAIREENRKGIAGFNKEEILRESIATYKMVVECAWKEYYNAPATALKERQKFLQQAVDAQTAHDELLQNIGFIEQAPQETVVKVSQEVLHGMTPEAQDIIVLALLQAQMKPLAEPRPDKLLEDGSTIEAEFTEKP
jgi:transposase